jgi:small-conductance mechanosensitive channel
MFRRFLQPGLSKTGWLIWTAVLVLGSDGQSQSLPEADKPRPSPSASPAPASTPENRPAIPAIPLPDVVDRAEETGRLLQEINDRISLLPEPESEERELRARLERLIAEAQATERMLAASPNLSEFWRQEQSWQRHRREYGQLRDQLNRRTAKLTEEIRLLDDRSAQWQATLQQTPETEGLKEVFDRIRASLVQIMAVRDRLSSRQRKLVTVENLLSQQEQITGKILNQIKTTRLEYEDSILVRDSYPLWDARAYSQNYRALKFDVGGDLLRNVRSLRHLLGFSNYWIAASVILFILAVLLARKLGRTVTQEDEAANHRLKILKYPVSLAMPVLLFSVIVFTHTQLPLGLISLLMLVLTIPIIRITPLLIEPSFRPLLYAFLAFFGADFARRSITASPVTERLALAGEAAAAIVFFAWPAYKLKGHKIVRYTTAIRIASPGVWLTVLLLAISLAANIFGNLTLSEVLLEGTLFSVFLAIVLLTGVRTCVVVINLLLQMSGSERLAVVRKYKNIIQAWSGRFFSAAAFFIWLVGTLEFFTVRDLVFQEVDQRLRRPLLAGALGFSLWDVILFFLFLICGLLIARATRFFMQEEVLARLPLRQGLPNAISTVFYYLMMAVVFIASLTAAGVELTRFTVLTGAIGVGIGIGLQNIINNLVSGLILLFERPIRLNDVVEVDGVKGEVKQIGIRATIIETEEGSEAVVPNSELISNRFLNWTLSNRLHRVELPISVSYGTELPTVLRLLEKAARSHRLVWPDPPPSVEFVAFGDSGLLLELQFWLLQDDNFRDAKNEVADLVNKALAEAGVGIPHQQMDLHLRDAD